jgi:ATP-dependent DNA ligase
MTRMLARRVRTDGFIDPASRPLPPSGPRTGWVHEIKHDGYRLIVRRDGKAVRQFTRRGYDWTDRYPAIAAVAAKLRAKWFTLDGEAVVAGADGVAVFDAPHRRHCGRDAVRVRPAGTQR